MKRKPKAWLVTFESQLQALYCDWQRRRYVELTRTEAVKHTSLSNYDYRNVKIIPLYAEGEDNGK